jgi:hypothetical protein
MYCRGNPIKYSDPSGYVITIEAGKNYDRINQYIDTLSKSEHGRLLLNIAHKYKGNVHIQIGTAYSEKGTRTRGSAEAPPIGGGDVTITLDEEVIGLIGGSYEATLGHELEHATQYIQAPDKYASEEYNDLYEQSALMSEEAIRAECGFKLSEEEAWDFRKSPKYEENWQKFMDLPNLY